MLHHIFIFCKGGFFSESSIHFLDLQISKKKLFQKTILSLKFKFPANYSILLLAGNLNFKLRIVFWNIFFWDLEIQKTHHTFWKKRFLTFHTVSRNMSDNRRTERSSSSQLCDLPVCRAKSTRRTADEWSRGDCCTENWQSREHS